MANRAREVAQFLPTTHAAVRAAGVTTTEIDAYSTPPPSGPMTRLQRAKSPVATPGSEHGDRLESPNGTLFTYREHATRYVVKNYLPPVGTQVHISGTDRAVLIDWLSEVCTAYGLSRDAAHLSIGLMDKYLSIAAEPVARRRLQLAGAACLLLGAKLEDRRRFRFTDLASLCDHQYEPREFGTAETALLEALEWRLAPPTTVGFVQCMVLSIANEAGEGDNDARLLLDIDEAGVQDKDFDEWMCDMFPTELYRRSMRAVDAGILHPGFLSDLEGSTELLAAAGVTLALGCGETGRETLFIQKAVKKWKLKETTVRKAVDWLRPIAHAAAFDDDEEANAAEPEDHVRQPWHQDVLVCVRRFM
jgi:hypothetical protein